MRDDTRRGVCPRHAGRTRLDFRLVPDQHPDQVLELLGAHLEAEGFADIDVTVLGPRSLRGHPSSIRSYRT
jgi:acetylornithine deacetylase/succinyl-diaminopimelate desuccinylase-like protein